MKSFLLHLRPRSWPTVAGHVLCGALMARGLEVFTAGAFLWRALAACFLWAVCLNGGTLAFNSAIDRDEGDIGFLNNPPPLPRGLAWFGLAVMGAGAVGGWFLGGLYFQSYLICVAMSYVYSARPLRLKARGGWDVAINMIGYGALTALAGWAAVAAPVEGSDWLIFAGFGFLFGAAYPMTQFYQKEEDARKGARTLALLLGDRGTMIFIHACLILANACWVVAAWGRGDEITMTLWRLDARPSDGTWTAYSVSPLGLVCLIAQAVLWFVFAAHWWMRFDGYPHQKGFYRSMVLWAISNIALVVAFTGY